GRDKKHIEVQDRFAVSDFSFLNPVDGSVAAVGYAIVALQRASQGFTSISGIAIIEIIDFCQQSSTNFFWQAAEALLGGVGPLDNDAELHLRQLIFDIFVVVQTASADVFQAFLKHSE